MTKPGVLRRRFLIGLILAAAIGVGLEFMFLTQDLKAGRAMLRQRIGVMMLQGLVDVAQRTAGTTDGIQTAVMEFAKRHSEVTNIRVVKGLRLEASTVAADTGDKAAPRRLARDEKTVFDQGQRLRAAVQTNRDEGVSRKEEIEIARGTGGELVLSAPLEDTDGSVTGFAQIQAAPSGEAVRPPSPVAPAAAVVAVVILFLIVSRFLPERKLSLALLTATLLVTLLGAYGYYGRATKDSALKMESQAVATRLVEEAKSASAALKAVSVEETPPLHPSRWDADVFRRPLGFVADNGTVIETKFSALRLQHKQELHQEFLATTILSLIVLALFGFGAASALVSTIIGNREAYSYTLPAMVGMIVLVFFPFLYGIALSFTGSTLYNSDKSITEIWTGLDNYKSILTNFQFAKHTAEGWVFNYQNFYWTLLFTIFWTVTNVAIGVSVGLVLALMLNTKGLALRPFYRVLLIFPWAMPNYITALIWRGMFHQQFGVVNQFLQILGAHPISWFEKPFTSYFTALATNGWLSFPFMMVVSLGALQSIPTDLYEAARVDGATRWQQFRSITLPSLKPALIPAVILSVVWTFNMFNIIYLVTAGEPAGSTEILITEAYKIAFEKYRYGYAAAYSTIIFIILLVYGSIQNRATRATEAIAG